MQRWAYVVRQLWSKSVHTLERLAALARVYRISPRSKHVEPLLSGGLDSSWSLSRKSAQRFVLLFVGSVVGLAYLRRRRRRHHGS